MRRSGEARAQRRAVADAARRLADLADLPDATADDMVGELWAIERGIAELLGLRALSASPELEPSRPVSGAPAGVLAGRRWTEWTTTGVLDDVMVAE
jgi:hypothetical protein